MRLPIASTQDRCHWRPPHANRFKMNVDATWTVDGAGVGSLTRDHFGWVRLSFKVALALSHSPEHAETVVLREALRLTGRFGYTNYILASGECKVVIDLLLARSGTLDPLGHIHEQILPLINRQAISYRFNVVIIISRCIYWLLKQFLPTPPMFGLKWFSLLFLLQFRQI